MNTALILQRLSRGGGGQVLQYRKEKVASGKGRVARKQWQVASGKCKVQSGEWRVASDECRVARDEGPRTKVVGFRFEVGGKEVMQCCRCAVLELLSSLGFLSYLGLSGLLS